jgi:hypothetical protein
MALFATRFDALLGLQQALDAFRGSGWLDAGPSGGGAYPPVNVFRKGDDFAVVAETPTPCRPSAATGSWRCRWRAPRATGRGRSRWADRRRRGDHWTRRRERWPTSRASRCATSGRRPRRGRRRIALA